MYIPRDTLPGPLAVITAIFNPVRWHTRYKWYAAFAPYIVASGAKLITVEAAFSDRAWALDGIAPDGDGHRYVKVRADDELWLKENLLNLGINQVPRNIEAIAWIDADVTFARQGAAWVWETLHQLAHYEVVQLFSDAVDLGPLYIPIQYHKSFLWCYHHHGYHHHVKLPSGVNGSYYQRGAGAGLPLNWWHPGFAWAARRSAIDKLGGLIDFAIAGAGDHHMARALIGQAESSLHGGLHPGYKTRVLDWQERAERQIDRQVGYVSGLLLHYWHGRKADRKYRDRWAILTEEQYNPDTDIRYDSQGVLHLVDGGTARQRRLRDRLMRYSRSRNEDSTALEGIEQNEWGL